MLYIKQGRIYTRSFSFVLPEEMSIVTDPENVNPDTLTFETVDGKFIIEIGASTSDLSPSEEISRHRAYKEWVFMTDDLPMARGEMEGLKVLYRSEQWRYEYYEEYLAFPLNEDGQNMFELCVQHEVNEETERNQIEAFMETPNIKDFLDSIRYEPNCCKTVIG